MGVLENMRVVLSARSFLQQVVSCKRVPTAGTTQVQETNHDLLLNFRRLTLSPTEAYLSSRVQAKAPASPLKNATDYSLTSVLKPVSITVPTLYNEVMIEKDLPSILNIMEKIEPLGPQQPVETPSAQVPEKQAARLIVIRRKKMKKHKLRKLRQKMRFVLLKRRQKREYKKEKLFQATQMAKVRKFESFDAVNYVRDVLQVTKIKPTPRTFKGKRLPEFLIKELMEKERLKKIKNRQEALEREELKIIKNNYTNKL